MGSSQRILKEPIATNPILHIDDLYVEFETLDGVSKVIDGVDLSLGKGEVVTIAGETGCGKSVTMKSILGLLENTSARIPQGKIEFDDTDLLNVSKDELDRIKGERMSMIFQDPMSSLNPTFTVGEQLTDTAQFGGGEKPGVIEYFWRKHHSDDRESARNRVQEMLGEVRMPDPERIMDSYPTELSGGMRQRALIAQALLNEPDLLIADEIGTALDVTIHDQILDLLKSLIDEYNLSVLLITHNLGVARQISDRIYVMYGGRTVETAPTKYIFDQPQHPYTQGLIASIPKLTGARMGDGIEGSVPDYFDPPEGCRFRPRCPYEHERCAIDPQGKFVVGEQRGVECHLFDSRIESPYDKPTLDQTRRKIGIEVKSQTAERADSEPARQRPEQMTEENQSSVIEKGTNE